MSECESDHIVGSMIRAIGDRCRWSAFDWPIVCRARLTDWFVIEGNMGIGYDGMKGDPGDKGSPGRPGKDCNISYQESRPGVLIGPPGPAGDKGEKVRSP